MSHPLLLLQVAEALRRSSAFRLEYQDLCAVKGVTRASHRRTVVGRYIPDEFVHDAEFREQISRYFDWFWALPARTHDTRNGAHDLSALPTNYFYLNKEQDEDICNGSKPMTPAQLHEVAITLENESEFCQLYVRPGRSIIGRRNLVNQWRKKTCQHLMGAGHKVADREQLRRYFDDTLIGHIAVDSDDEFYELETVQFWKDEVRHPEDRARLAAPLTINTIAQELTMNATKTPIEITTKTLINGVDVKDYTDSQVYALIAAQEADIKELEKIEAKLKKLVAEIEKRKAGIAALVAYLDSKE